MTTEFQKFIKGFYYAFEGIKTGSKERNFRVHMAVAVLVLFASVFFQISGFEWIIVVISIAAVISAELFNSAIESICNLISDKLKLAYLDTWDPRNLAAGAVLVVALAAAIVGSIIFLPKILMFLA